MKCLKGIVLSIVLCLFCLSAMAQDSCDTLFSDLTRVKKARSNAVTSSASNVNSNLDRRTYIQSNETFVMADVKGPGIINHIWLTFNEARPNWLEEYGSAKPSDIVLRMYWDGSEDPAVEAPIGDFFAAGFGQRHEIRSLPVLVEGGDGYNCYWQMPFHKRAKITVTNEGEKKVRSFYYHIDYTEVESLLKDTAYFCAQYRQEFPEKEGRDYLICDAEGWGHYVGTVMSVRSRSPFWFGEGDARIYINGEEKPSIKGTGTEDYFLMAWGLNEALFPFFGCTYQSSGFSDLGVKYTLYRWHIADPIRFTESFRFEIEHTGWITGDETETGEIDGHVEREDDVATVAFWYQVGQPKRFTELPSLKERELPNLDITIQSNEIIETEEHSKGTVTLQEGYDWTGGRQILFDPGSENGCLEVSFEVKEEDYRGIMLILTHAPDYGIYRIYLDGENIKRPEDYIDPDKPYEIDFYSEQMDVKEIYMGSYTLPIGTHTLRFECAGKNPYSKGYILGLDSVRLRERWEKKRKSLR